MEADQGSGKDALARRKEIFEVSMLFHP